MRGRSGGARQPWIKRGRLALTDEGSDVWRGSNGLRQSEMFGELRQRLMLIQRHRSDGPENFEDNIIRIYAGL